MATAPTFGAAGTYLASASTTSAVIDAPAGVASGDFVLVSLHLATTAAVTPPAGFTEATTAPATTVTGAHTHRLFYKRSTGDGTDDDADTYTFTWAGAALAEGVAHRWAGVNTATVTPTSTTATTGSTSQTGIPGIAFTALASQRTIVWIGSSSATGAWTPPTGFTERVDTGARLSIASLANPALGVTGIDGGAQSSGTHTTWGVIFSPVPTAPVVSAGADITVDAGTAIARTGTVTDDGGASAITAEGWTIVSGPTGAGDTLSTSSALAWTPYSPGAYVLRYSHTRAGGTGTDDVTVYVTSRTRLLERSLSGGQMWVEVAWGADLAADPDTWAWSDITADVREPDGQAVEITVGRANEASETQPAQCTLTLDNSTGAYGLGGTSANWPNVRRNTPIRVRVFCDDLDEGVSRFEGYVVSWQPDWDITGRDATVAVTAAGELRRLLQNTTPGISPYRRAVSAGAATSGIVAYWPCEEAGVVTGGFSPAVGTAPLRWSLDFLPPKPAESDAFLCSDPLPTIESAELYGAVPRYTASGAVQVRMLIEFPESGLVENQPILLVDVSGSTNWWIVHYYTGGGGGLGVRVLNAAGTELYHILHSFDVEGRAMLLDLALVQNGGNVDYDLTLLEQGAKAAATAGGSAAGTVGVAQAVWVNTFVDRVDDGVAPAEVLTPSSASMTVGHITVGSTIRSVFDNLTEFNAYAGEDAADRFGRICNENGIRAVIWVSTDGPDDQITDLMGPQAPGDTLTLLREVEQVDKGVLYDGPAFGLTYRTRRVAQTLAGGLELEQGFLSSGFAPVDDDQGQANQVTVQVARGGTVVAEDSTGPLGVDTIGLYASQVTLNVASEEAAIQHAAWHVRHGTVEGYRYPTLGFSLATFPALVANWVTRELGNRVDVADPTGARSWAPGETLSFSLLGYTETIGSHRWDVTLNVAPYAPWRILELGASASDTGEYVPHLDTLGAELATAMAVGATSISVATTAGPVWTTSAAAFPLVLDVGGIPVTATACAGGSSPQTFTITGSTATTAKAAGTPVQVWAPPVLGL